MNELENEESPENLTDALALAMFRLRNAERRVADLERTAEEDRQHAQDIERGTIEGVAERLYTENFPEGYTAEYALGRARKAFQNAEAYGAAWREWLASRKAGQAK